MLKYDEYYVGGNPNYRVQEEYYTNVPYDTGTSINWVFPSLTCPHCKNWITQHQWYNYCPYCGKELFPTMTKKATILERLDTILKEVKEIKEELANG